VRMRGANYPTYTCFCPLPSKLPLAGEEDARSVFFLCTCAIIRSG
jgi:hypothetical protein